METRLRSSPEQFSIMLNFMETHGDLSRPQLGPQVRRLWSELTTILNSVGRGGMSKTSEKWKKVWSDWKAKTKKKAFSINRNISNTDGGPAINNYLNPLEKRVLRIIGFNSMEQLQELKEADLEILTPPVVHRNAPRESIQPIILNAKPVPTNTLTNVNNIEN
ncbi:uncharacterized protein LOC142985820 [Anticarsia gemmatalis]|uniref:uncharacterized protein LOC142985820 n=1 Tax=Anticarsia gemmatalis TaxID=129554 RepID=UPI003F75CE4D